MDVACRQFAAGKSLHICLPILKDNTASNQEYNLSGDETTDLSMLLSSYHHPHLQGSHGTYSHNRRKIVGAESMASDLQPELPFGHNCSTEGCEWVRINVSGLYFETRLVVLNRHPNSVLGDPEKRDKYYDSNRMEYFFDRHRPSFEAIFTWYQNGGKLRRPQNIPDEIFLTEVGFFELDKEIVEDYKKDEGYAEEEIILPENEILKTIWMLFEYPETSRLAFIIGILSCLFTMTSIVLFCVETLPHYSNDTCSGPDDPPSFVDPFFVIETMCTAWFTIEFIIRLISSPNKLKFWKDVKNLVDLTAVVPYYVTLINVIITMTCESSKTSSSLAFLRVIRLVRVFKLTKHSAGLQVLVLTFKASMGGLGLFVIALFVCTLVFSSTIYYMELGIPGSEINSIPDGFWWAVITMSTVGYGDKVPKGTWGKIVGCVCALSGLLTLAIPVPIILENFIKFYAHKTGRGRVG
ncbi:unnamed protein product [Owenia fusiformis]|uniref:Uncharacterized protein n=1 Tax=Owenia fusiformis TaxID=6347 RepID=A0A8J1T743_OWEFU|nr:unnamed protein product [Owenia fusiformis]